MDYYKFFCCAYVFIEKYFLFLFVIHVSKLLIFPLLLDSFFKKRIIKLYINQTQEVFPMNLDAIPTVTGEGEPITVTSFFELLWAVLFQIYDKLLALFGM